MGRQPRLLELDVLAPEVAVIGDHASVISRISRAGSAVSFNRPISTTGSSPLWTISLFSRRQRLEVVADGDPGMRGHRPAVRIGEGIWFRPCSPISSIAVLLRFSLRASIFSARLSPARRPSLFRRVALVEALEIVGQSFVRGPDEIRQRIAGEIAILVVDRLDPRAVHRQQFPANSSSHLHSSVNARNTDLNAARLSARKSAIVLKSGFRVRNSQMTSMLRSHSASSRRLDRTRFK